MSIVFSPAAPCNEELGTAQESAALEGGVTASVTLRCAYSDRFILANDLLSNLRPWPKTTLATPPRAQTAAIRPAGDAVASSQGLTYEHALITVTYGNKIVDLVSESLEPVTDFITLDHHDFRWGSATGEPVLEREAPGKLRRFINLVRTYYNLSSVPAGVLDLPGTCNDTEYVSPFLGITFAPETLMLGDPQLSQTITTAGSKGFNLTLKWTYNKDGWNKFWRSKDEDFVEMYHVGGTVYKNYPPEDHSALWV